MLLLLLEYVCEKLWISSYFIVLCIEYVCTYTCVFMHHKRKLKLAILAYAYIFLTGQA